MCIGSVDEVYGYLGMYGTGPLLEECGHGSDPN